MSFKRMVTKLALAFAAQKGMEAFRNAGGLDGLRDMLAGQPQTATAGGPSSGMSGRVGGTRSSDAGGLGNILSSLGYAGASNGRESGVSGQISPLQGSLGSLFGALATALGSPAKQQSMEEKLDEQFDDADLNSRRDAEPIVRAMVQMARADGQIDEHEKSALFDILHDASADEQATLQKALREPVNAQAVALDTPAHARKEVYTAALLVGDPENGAESKYLQSLSHALNLTGDEVTALHDATGKARLI